MTVRTGRLLLALGAFVAGLVLFSAVIFIVTGRSPTPIAMPSAVGGPFKLVDQNSNPITDQDLKGHPFLVFFGFTHCPDVCPTTLFEVPNCSGRTPRMSSALFVTVDPSDTQVAISVELRSARHRATGDEGAIAAVERLRVYAKKVPVDGGGYTMTTRIVYLMNKDGRFVTPFNMKRRPEEAAPTSSAIFERSRQGRGHQINFDALKAPATPGRDFEVDELRLHLLRHRVDVAQPPLEGSFSKIAVPPAR